MTTETEPTQAQRDSVATRIITDQGWYDGSDPLEAESYDECLYSAGAAEFLILTDEEADTRTADYVHESLWAFSAEFLAAYMPEGISAEDIEAIRGDRCEDANQAMIALVHAGPCTIEDLTSDAISADGRGHFLARYDGEEIEHHDGARYWYGYRVN